jgi:Tol biopolymer transport system component/tRNA A-37 threonylcarbamoyl transferase component Bud32
MGPGDRLGQYEIVSALGAGGMGEVFRARDTRLDREVAIKILSASLARDPDALARFEREATSIAKLSHPNILAIHEFGRHADTAFVVTELIDGETLRARLANGPLPPRRAVAYAHQIARGIAAAHARGVVHRDLKPENVMIGRDDQIKILDFGLAKPIAPAAGEETRAISVNTSAGTVLGTFGYMAPEQVRGLAVDHRADIFSFGAVIYEMLSGERAFTGDTAADTMTAILTKDPPDLDVTRLSISPALDRIVRRCLEKTPELRFQSANDLAFALENLSTSSSSSSQSAEVSAFSTTVASAKVARWNVVIPWVIAALTSIAAIATWFLRPAVVRDPPWQQFTAITEAAGEETAPALSPDGGTVVFVMRQAGRWGIYAQRVGGRNHTAIVTDADRDFRGPAYSPDGASIAFHDAAGAGGIFVAGATGESVRRVTDSGFDPAWSPDGKQIAFATEETQDPASRLTISTLYVVDAAGGAPKKLVDGDAVQPAWSPSGRRVVYWSNTGGQRDLFTVPRDGGSRVAITNDGAIDWSPVWSPDGKYVYYSSDRGGAMNLWRIAVDESSGAASGQPEPVTNGVQAWASLPRFSRDGSRLAFRSRVRSVNPIAIPFDPVTGLAGVPVVLDGSNNIRIPSDVSRDGTQIAYFSIGERQEDLFIGSADGTRLRRLTDDAARDRAPMFTRDGKAVLFYSNRDGAWAAWTIRLDGSGLRRIAGSSKGLVYPLPSPVDDRIVFTTSNDMELYLADFAGAEPQILPNSISPRGGLNGSAFSPDGRKVAGPINAPSGRGAGVGVYDLQARTMTHVSDDETFGARWLPDNRRLVYFTAAGSQFVVLDTVTRARTLVPLRLPSPSIDDFFAISPDGRTIYYGGVRTEADIWITERK